MPFFAFRAHPQPRCALTLSLSIPPCSWSEAGRTEVVLNNNSPDFSTVSHPMCTHSAHAPFACSACLAVAPVAAASRRRCSLPPHPTRISTLQHVKIPFHFEETQPVRIALFDWDGGKLPGMGSGSTMARATGHEKIDAATGQPTGQWEGAAADFLGCISTTLGRIMGSRGSTLVVPVHTTADGSADAASAAAAAAHSGGSSGGAGAAATVAAAPNGVLVVSGAEVKGDNDAIRITFSGKKLDAKDGFLMFGRTSDPYIAICSPLPADLKGTPWEATPYAAAATAAASSGSGGSSTSASTGRRQMWVGPVLKKTVDPVWPTCDLPIASICPGGDKGAPLMLECWDWDAGSAHDLIGVTGPVTVEQLASMSGSGTPMTLVNPKKKAKSGYTNSGELRVDNAFIYHVPTLLDYVTGGCQLSLMVAVDFTGSNGDPRDPRSLHFWNPDPRAPLNAYGQAIVSVGNILQEYDSDKRFPAYGFGGNVGGRTLHCFALNGNDAAPDVLGVQGLLQSYQMALSTTGLSGPTLFAPMIQRAIHTCRIGGGVTQERQHYTTLLLITE